MTWLDGVNAKECTAWEMVDTARWWGNDGEVGVVPVHTSCSWRRLFGRSRTLLLLWEVIVREMRGARCEDGRRCGEPNRMACTTLSGCFPRLRVLKLREYESTGADGRAGWAGGCVPVPGVVVAVAAVAVEETQV